MNTVKNEATRKEWLEKILGSIEPGLRLLDAGAGQLANQKYCRHLDYVSQDFCQYQGTGNAKGLQRETWDTTGVDIVSDITSIPEKDEAFDVILCSEVLEHVPAPVQALEEFHRLLKTGGTLILTAPFCSLTHFAPYHYSSGFNRYFYELHLPRLGFHIDTLEANGNFFAYLAQEIRRLPTTAQTYTSRKMSLFARLALKVVFHTLGKFSREDRGSDELLCFGYHVVATKN